MGKPWAAALFMLAVGISLLEVQCNLPPMQICGLGCAWNTLKGLAAAVTMETGTALTAAWAAAGATESRAWGLTP